MKRLDYIALLRALAIIIVVAFHVNCFMYGGCFPESQEAYKETYFWFNQCLIINIAMPMFTFISGFLFNYLYSKGGKYRKFVQFAKNKFRRLWLPLIVFGSIFLVTTGNHDFYSLLVSCTYVHLWYLPVLFWCFIIAWLILRYVPNRKYRLMLLPLFFVVAALRLNLPYLFGIHGVPRWFWMFYMGIVFVDYEETISGAFKRFYLWIPFLAIFLFVTYSFPTEYDVVTLHKLLVAPLMMSSVWYLFSRIRNFDNIVCKALLNISRYSFGIYIFHIWIIMYCVCNTSKRIFSLPELAADHIFLFPTGLTVVVFGVSYLLTYLLLKTRAGRYLLG